MALPLLLAGCAAGTPEAPSRSPVEGQHVITETVAAPSLEGNLLGDPAERTIMVYLPPSYYTSGARYPVVYFLAGYSQAVGTFSVHIASLWGQMQQDGMTELIIVEIDGINSLGGNFYANSPVGGNAEDFLTRDLVSHIDSTYRTIPQASARGLSGMSMGGSGTINVGLANPDVYGSLYANSPGLLVEDGGLEAFLLSNGNWLPYGAAFAPDVEAGYPYLRPIDAAAPLEGQDPDLVAAWESGYGDLRAKIADYLAQPARLRAIRVAYGTLDSYPWIPEGSAYFLDLLAENGIPASEHVFDGGHTIDSFYFQQDFVEFFSENLTG